MSNLTQVREATEDELRAYHAQVRDVEIREVAKRAFRQMLDDAPNGVIHFDTAGGAWKDGFADGYRAALAHQEEKR